MKTVREEEENGNRYDNKKRRKNRDKKVKEKIT